MKDVPHLGEIIAKHLEEAGMTKAEFGRRIKTSRQNVALILEKQSLNVEQVWIIGEVLKVNLFDILSENFPVKDVSKGLTSPATLELRLEMSEGKLAKSLEGMFRALLLEVQQADG